jgi:hypothetical protein
MRAIQLKKSEFYAYNNTSFLLLGDEMEISKNIKNKRLEKKLKREEKKTLPGFWGTMGWKNNAAFDIGGEIRISRTGNLTFKEKRGIKHQLLQDLVDVNEGRNIKAISIREFFIDLSDVQVKFPKEFNINDIPTFRFDLFLEDNEGAVVYMEHKSKSGNEEDDFVEFVMCERTDANFSSDRDRLCYFIPAVPAHKVTQVSGDTYRLANELQSSRPTIRIFTFKRKKAQASQIVNGIVGLLNRSKKDKKDTELVDFMLRNERYALLKFDPTISAKISYNDNAIETGGLFLNCTATQIDPNAKTLLLIHGTFSSTLGSHGMLFRKQGRQPSVLQELLRLGHYQQILAFDHITIAHNAQMNADWLHDYIKDIKFTKSLDVITTSRGALVGEHLSQDKRFKGRMDFNRVLMFSPAHGCGYFKAGPFVSKGLSVLRLGLSSSAGKLMLGYLQNSVQYFLEQPGAKMLHVNSDEVKHYLSAEHNNPQTKFINVIADWDKSLNPKSRWFKYNKAKVLDTLIQSLLGKENDWVIGCEQQKLKPTKAKDGGNFLVHSVHGGTFDNEHAFYRGTNPKPYNAQELIIEALLK